MRWKTTLVLLTATIGIGAYISLHEIRQPSPEARERRSKQILDIPEASVTQLALEMPTGNVTLMREGEAWRLASNQARADQGVVERLLWSLSPLTADRILSNTSDHPLDLTAFGLDPAVGSLTVVSGEIPRTLWFGEATPVEGKRYLKVSGRPEVFIIPSSLFDSANQPAEAFRDPLLIRLSPWTVERVTVTSASTTFVLERNENDWHLTQPLLDRADRAEVTTLLNRLGGIRIQRFVDDAPQIEQLSLWGLDKPSTEVTLVQQESAVTTTIFVGAPLPEPKLLYAKRSDEPFLYAVNASDVENLLRDPHGLRAKACLEFFTNQVTKVEVRSAERAWTIAKSETTWYEEETAEPALERSRVEAFLDQLADLRLSGFVEEAPADLTRYGLEPAAGIITVWTSASDTPQRLSIGTTIEGSTDRYGRIEGRQAVVRLPQMVETLLATTPATLRPPSPDATPPAPTPAPRGVGSKRTPVG